MSIELVLLLFDRNGHFGKRTLILQNKNNNFLNHNNGDSRKSSLQG